MRNMKNETMDVIEKRASLRAFSNDPITKEEEDAIIHAAMRAPSAGNQMMYSMIIIRDQKKKELLAEACDHQPFIAKAPLMIVFVADHQRWFDYFQSRGVKEFCKAKDRLFEAPQESELMLAIEDAMIAAQNSVIAAQSMNIGSCYIGDILENGEYTKELLQLPQYTMPIGMVVYGHYPDGFPHLIRERFDRKFIVFEDVYHSLNETERDEMFHDLEQKFQLDNPYGAENYAQQFYARKTGASFSKEMARSVRFWLKQWDGRLL